MAPPAPAPRRQSPGNQVLPERVAVAHDLDHQQFGFAGEGCERRGAEQSSAVDGHQEFADLFDFTEQVRRDDDANGRTHDRCAG